MNIFYVIGIYAVCVEIHETINDIPDILSNIKHIAKDVRSIKNIATGKEELKDSDRSRMKTRTMNKIGF